ncbi:hypothetical protein [Pseudoxanthomonas sp. SE1]|uniref:hypothetical protein n=1 Tax=Pseudoxanthomonas sp. SE1 TaxID=1664560 RepID=UPI00240D8B85|nr:hypothetical protein [Pseudoxanthomonas sp. SE1]WFC43234.1 hypothetical protein OY559_06910 [Pseudoxanthomonas sp. SE1]
MLRFASAPLLLLLAGAATAQDGSFAVFGIPFGVPLTVPECTWREGRDYMSADRRATKREYKNAMWSDESGPCFIQSLRNIGKPIEEGESVSILFPLQERPSMSKRGSLGVRIVDGKADYMTVHTLGLAGQTHDLAELTEKFGTPTSIEHPKAQNRMGATFETTEATWSLKGGVSVTYHSALSTTDEGLIVITTTKGALAEKRAMDDFEKQFGGRDL